MFRKDNTGGSMKAAACLGCLIFILCGCNLYYAKPYYIRDSQTMEVVGYDYTKDGSVDHARKSAEYACKCQSQGRLIILEETTAYNGALGNERIDKLADAAKDVSWTIGKTDTSRAIGAAKSPKDYLTKLQFRCQ